MRVTTDRALHQFNLGWKLALVEKGIANKSLLETYNAERLPVISEMLEVTTSILDRAVTSGDNQPDEVTSFTCLASTADSAPSYSMNLWLQ